MVRVRSGLKLELELGWVRVWVKVGLRLRLELGWRFGLRLG